MKCVDLIHNISSNGKRILFVHRFTAIYVLLMSCSVVTNFGFILFFPLYDSLSCSHVASKRFLNIFTLTIEPHEILSSRSYSLSYYCFVFLFYLCSFDLFCMFLFILYVFLIVFIIPRFICSPLVCHISLLCISHSCRKDRMNK